MADPVTNGRGDNDSLNGADAKRALASSSTSTRIKKLQALGDAIAHDTTPENVVVDLLQHLFRTHALYADRESRTAVQKCLTTIIQHHNDPKILSPFVEAIRRETQKPAISPSSAFVLLEWCSLLMQRTTNTPLWDKLGKDVLLSLADVLEKCLQPATRKSMAHSAVIVTRRGLRKLFSPAEVREAYLASAVATLSTKASQPTARYAPLLGVIAGVAARQAPLKSILQTMKQKYYDFYIREIVGSRTAVPAHMAAGLADFFAEFSEIEEIEQQVLPTFEKGLLRAPEVLLGGVLQALIAALPERFDLSHLFEKKLLKPLLSSTKSSNASIRSGALTSFRTIIARCQTRDAIDRIAEEIITPLRTGKLPTAEHRIIHAEMLQSVPLSAQSAEKISSALAMISSKEGNEAALAAETQALSTSASYILSHGQKLPQTVEDSFVRGIGERKPALRRLWLLRTGSLLLPLNESGSSPAEMAFARATLPKLLDSFKEVTENTIAAAQAGLTTGAYILTSLAPAVEQNLLGTELRAAFSKLAVMGSALSINGKQSFLLNYRVYTKLGAEEELTWFRHALCSALIHAQSAPEPDVLLAWAEAMTYLITSPSVASAVQQESIKALSLLYARKPGLVGKIIVDGLWQAVTQTEANDRESRTSELVQVLKSICIAPPEVERISGKAKIDSAILEKQACALLILARPELIPRSSWIELCLRMGVDPGDLAGKHGDALAEEIEVRTSLSQKSDNVREAAYKAAADLAFVAPESMMPKLIDLLRQDLGPSPLRDIGPMEAAIFRAPEGTCVVDVLAKKKQDVVPNKNDKNYDILKWEEEMRSQIEKKKGQQRKLTPEESSRVNAQLKKESAIRLAVAETANRVLRGIGIIRSLATGPPVEASLWLGAAVDFLLNAMAAGAGLITGSAAQLAFIDCADKVSSRLGPMRPFVGVATLRLQGMSLSENYGEEDLEALVTRVLYRLRFAGEQRPFDAVSFIYILPLLFEVLKNGGCSSNDDDRDAQLVIAIEIISFHTDVCSDEAVPRVAVLSHIIEAMQKYTQHFKLIKDCFSDLCRCIAPNIRPEECAVLAKGAVTPQASVRTVVLQSTSAEVDMSELQSSDEIWIACHDDLDENKSLGLEIWEESEFQVALEVPLRMTTFLEAKDPQLRRAAARALAGAAKLHPKTVNEVVAQLESSYIELAKPRVQQLDEFGMPKKMDLADPWEARQGIATGFKEVSAIMELSQLQETFAFMIEHGPLGDRNPAVREEMLNAAIQAIELQGKPMLGALMDKFEHTLEQPGQNNEFSDRVNEAVIIMYGALAHHLKPGDAKIPIVIERLLATLSTPSETVQFAIAECLPPLVRAGSEKSSKYFDRIMDELLNSKKYAVQRGAAYGLAGLIEGRGISALREYRLVSALNGAMDNKKEASQREAALIAFELMSVILGRLFEPYVLQIVPQLLSGFGDSNTDVRDACLAAAKACFARLSSYGVKKIMPVLLDGLDDQQWRSKRGACELLGAMAYLDPEQLASSLPEIIPPLTGVLNDSHKEVRAAANRSLKRFGEVITNPEVKSLVGILLKALSDPTKYTDDALDALIKVQFVHYLDAPSLALITRVLQRGLDDRSNTKRKAAQVIGSLAHLTEKKDIIIHLPVLVAGLKIAIVDPVPTTRATASRALGSLVEKLGEETLPDLIPGLMQTLKSDTGAGDRLGSAQALSEVLAGLGTARLEETLPTILQNVESSRAAVREGFMSLFIFLPVCFGNSFSSYLGRIVPPILSGLADDIESIRDTALRAGRLLVKNFASRAVDLLLPELERGLADDSYRIRLSSVELVGDLLFNLTGIKADAEPGDEDDETLKEASASLKEVLGEEKRNKILSALYVCRCDTANAVRSAAISVWKVLVHSPRTLKELVPTLTQLLIRRLGSSNMEHKVIASNALGELIRKAGDGVLSSLLPTLEEGLQTSTDSDAKEGICLALRELIASASPEALEDHEKTLISVVRTALTDSDEEVREAAAEAFDSLQQILGKRAVDQVLPYLLNLLRSEEEADNALAALLTLLTETTRSNIILPNLIPTLTTPPISAFDAKALASLSRVAGTAMNRRLPNIINSLMDNEISCKDEDLREELGTSFDTVIQSIDEYDGLNTVMNVLLGLLKNDDHRKRAATARHMGSFFSSASVDYSRYSQDIVRSLLNSFDDSDVDVVKASWSALSEFTKKLRKEEMESLVISTRQTLQRVGTAGANLRGFELPKGVNAILPIFLQGLMNGTADQRTHAAMGISDIVDRTSEASLKPFVVQITGPLIRVVSERATEVRSAILFTLNNLLEKMPVALKPFMPQLQRTFAKSLADPGSEILRSRAAKALGTLIKYTPRIDPLIAELVTGSKTVDPGVKTAMLKALYEVISKAGGNMGETARAAVLSLIDMDTDDKDQNMAMTNAKLLGALIKNVPEEAALHLLKGRVLTTPLTTSSVLALNAVLVESADVLLRSSMADELPDLLCKGMLNKSTFVADNCILATGKLLLSSPPKGFETITKIFETMASIIQPGNPTDSRRLTLVTIRTISRSDMDLVRPHVPRLAPPVFASVRDPVIPVKLAAEATFVELFSVAEEESRIFDKYMAGPGAELPPNTKRSMGDYFKRVALRLGSQSRERREAEGGQGGLGLSNDEADDEREIWSVGKVEVTGDMFA